MITIRRFIRTDLPFCAELLKDVYEEPPYEEIWSPSRAEAYLGSFVRIDADGAFVATASGDTIVGAIFGFSYPWQANSIFFIQELFVALPYRRRGIAGDLVRTMVQEHGGDLHVALIVRQGTVAAELYEKLGLNKSVMYELRTGKLRA